MLMKIGDFPGFRSWIYSMLRYTSGFAISLYLSPVSASHFEVRIMHTCIRCAWDYKRPCIHNGEAVVCIGSNDIMRILAGRKRVHFIILRHVPRVRRCTARSTREWHCQGCLLVIYYCKHDRRSLVFASRHVAADLHTRNAFRCSHSFNRSPGLIFLELTGWEPVKKTSEITVLW